MKIKRTLFTKEIEITIDELIYGSERLDSRTGLFDLIFKFLTKLTK